MASYPHLSSETEPSWLTGLVWSAGPGRVSLRGSSVLLFPLAASWLYPRVLGFLVFFSTLESQSLHSELKETNLRFLLPCFSGQMGFDLFERRRARQMTEWESPEERMREWGLTLEPSPRSTHGSSSMQNHRPNICWSRTTTPSTTWFQILASCLLCDLCLVI